MADQLCVAALRLDNGRDVDRIAAGISRDQAVRQVRMPDSRAVVDALHRMFLDQNPSIAAVFECTDELVTNLRMIRQCHLRRRKPADAAQRVETENRRKIVLPGVDVKPEILNGS